MKTRFAFLAALLVLAGCHSQPTAGGLSAEDERELDNAAALLDQQNIFEGAPEGVTANAADALDGQGGAAANTGGVR